MPGGTNYRQWYAMRKRLQEQGRWRGREGATHSVPAQEEGEPEPKRHEADVPETPSPSHVSESPAWSDVTHVSESTPESLPPLEATPTSEGNYVIRTTRILICCMG